MQSMLQTSAAKANQALDAHRFDPLGLDVTFRRMLERGKIHQEKYGMAIGYTQTYSRREFRVHESCTDVKGTYV